MSSFHQILRDAKSRIEETDSVGAAALIAEGYRVLDVREPEEYEQGSIPNALHIPRGILENISISCFSFFLNSEISSPTME